MRTNRIFAIAAAVAALAACTKEQAIETGSSFKKGQEVTLNVTADASVTKVASELNSDKKVGFTWEEGDSIKVTIGTQSSAFKLTTGAGTNSATFTGTMPAAGDTFSVQYPYTEPDLANQTYSSDEPLPRDMMKFAATGCTISSPTFSLSAQNAVLRLNFYGYDRKVSQIAVADSSTLKTYTLNIETPVKVGKTIADSTSFFIVVDSDTTAFSVAVTTEEVSPAVDNTVLYEENGYSGLGTVITHSNFATSSAQILTAGRILNMPAKSLTTVWAPVNCGYSSDSPNPWDYGCYYGQFYQWGRKYGCGYADGNYDPSPIQNTSSTTTPIESSAEVDTVFYQISAEPFDWLYPQDSTRWNSGTESSPVKTIYDPCPTGWRVPTKTEMEALICGNYQALNDTYYGEGFWVNAYYFNGTSSCTEDTPGAKVYLPAAGCRLYNGKYFESTECSYWTSTANNDEAYKFWAPGTKCYLSGRAEGNMVRCVLE